MKVAVAQIAPVFLDRAATTAKVVAAIDEAAAQGSELVAFGESLIPGYPAWLSRRDGARFEAPELQEMHALYLEQSLRLEDGHLEPVQEAARRGSIAVVLGFIERAADRGGHSAFCSRAIIDGEGALLSVHRKLMPTYEERLVWAAGDAAGLRVHRLGAFGLGALNCWENWMPLARAALYAQGLDLHVMLWPGSRALTRDITRFVALEGRSFVLSAGALLRAQDIPDSLPGRAALLAGGDTLYDGGSAIAGPDGAWIHEPTAEEGLITAELSPRAVLAARQSFDAAGHYARPDCLRLSIDRRRQAALDEHHRPT